MSVSGGGGGRRGDITALAKCSDACLFTLQEIAHLEPTMAPRLALTQPRELAKSSPQEPTRVMVRLLTWESKQDSQISPSSQTSLGSRVSLHTNSFQQVALVVVAR